MLGFSWLRKKKEESPKGPKERNESKPHWKVTGGYSDDVYEPKKIGNITKRNLKRGGLFSSIKDARVKRILERINEATSKWEIKNLLAVLAHSWDPKKKESIESIIDTIGLIEGNSKYNIFTVVFPHGQSKSMYTNGLMGLKENEILNILRLVLHYMYMQNGYNIVEFYSTLLTILRELDDTIEIRTSKDLKTEPLVYYDGDDDKETIRQYERVDPDTPFQ